MSNEIGGKFIEIIKSFEEIAYKRTIIVRMVIIIRKKD